MTTVCVLAHQDDEMAMAARIAFEVRSGQSVQCVILTNGSARGADPSVRDAESLAVLTRIGVRPEDVFFLGSRHGIADGTLVHSLDRALTLLDEHLAPTPIHQIYCLAWEGGHPDHDASHLVALGLARRRGLLDKVWQFPLYHGRGTPGPLFRVMAPLDTRTRSLTRRIAFHEGLRVALLPLHYRSQRSSWIGLFPEALLKLVVLRREVMQEARPDAVQRKPHVGKLFYERRFGVDYESWRTHAEEFIRQHVAADTGSSGLATGNPPQLKQDADRDRKK